MAHILQLLADELLTEAANRESLQASRCLSELVSGMRKTLIALSGGAAMPTGAGLAAGSVHVLRGSARLVVGKDCTELNTHDSAPLPAGPHVIHGDAEPVILHSVVLPFM